MNFSFIRFNNVIVKFRPFVYILSFKNHTMFASTYKCKLENREKLRNLNWEMKPYLDSDVYDILKKFRCNIFESVDRSINIPKTIEPFTKSYFKQVQSIYNLCDCLHDFVNNFQYLRKRTNNRVADRLKNVILKIKDDIEEITDDIMVELATNSCGKYAQLDDVAETLPNSSSSSLISPLNIKQEPETNSSIINFESSDEDSKFGEIMDKIVQEKGFSSSTNDRKRLQMCPESEIPKKERRIQLIESPKKDNTSSNFKMDNKGHVIVYVDGSCLNNGKPNATAGCGVWFNYNHPLNVSTPCRGPPTNNNAEIQAASEAIRIVSQNGFKKAVLRTDSQFLINCMSNWIHSWKKNDWKGSKNTRVKNYESLVELDALLLCMESVKWEYVEAHHGIEGNEMADQLAKEGARKAYLK